MDHPLQAMQTLAAGSLLFAAFTFLVAAAYLVLWFAALIHCLQFKHDKDRVVWVLVVMLVPFGGILYFVMGRIKSPPQLPLRAATRNTATLSGCSESGPQIDILAMQDERKRTASINDALRALGEANRLGRSANYLPQYLENAAKRV